MVDTSVSGMKGEKLTPGEEMATQRVKSSVQFKDGKYELSMPWKPDVAALPNNYDMAVDRLLSTEKRLLKDSLLSGAYSNIIADYLRKGYK